AIFRINGEAAPVKGTEVTRIDQTAIRRWWCITTIIIELVKLNTAHHLINEASAPHVFFFQHRRLKTQTRVRLRWSDMFTCNQVTLRRCAFFDRYDWLACCTIQYIHIALFGG